MALVIVILNWMLRTKAFLALALLCVRANVKGKRGNVSFSAVCTLPNNCTWVVEPGGEREALLSLANDPNSCIVCALNWAD